MTSKPTKLMHTCYRCGAEKAPYTWPVVESADGTKVEPHFCLDCLLMMEGVVPEDVLTDNELDEIGKMELEHAR